MSVIKIGLNGFWGKMGQAIDMLAQGSKDFIITAKLGSSSTHAQIHAACTECDVMIDFSTPQATSTLIAVAAEYKTKLLIGTTGLTPEHMQQMADLAQETAVIHAPNTSIGANLIADLAARSVKILKNYDAEIIEAHHRQKKDAPSGTAIMIGKAIANARGVEFNENAVFGRSGENSRRDGEIGFSSIRGGGIFGDNEVIFAGDDEMISIGCRAFSRKNFAQGALTTAKWLINKEPGLYSMRDVLGLDIYS